MLRIHFNSASKCVSVTGIIPNAASISLIISVKQE